MPEYPIPAELQAWYKALSDDQERFTNQPRLKILWLIERVGELEHKLRGAYLAVETLDHTLHGTTGTEAPLAGGY
jgi:hypothetical protein